MFITWKTNYVEIALNIIEKEHGSVTFSELEEVRINSYVRYHTRKDKDGRRFKKIALDEC